MKQKPVIVLILLFIFLSFVFIRSCFPNEGSTTKVDLVAQRPNKPKLAGSKYKDLFSADAISQLSISYVKTPNDNFSYEKFFYDTDYSLIVHKVRLIGDTVLDSIATFEKDKHGLTPDAWYIGSEGDHISFSHYKYADSLAKKVIVGFSDSLISFLSLGSDIKSYNLLGTKFSIRYDEHETKDIVIDSKQGRNRETKMRYLLGLNLVLYKKDKYLYLILAYPRDRGRKIGADFILKLLDTK